MEEAQTSHRSVSFWVVLIATALLFLLSAAMIGLSLTSGARLAGKALMQGQRAIVSFQTGIVEGSIHKDTPSVVVVPPPPKPPEPVTVNPPVQLPAPVLPAEPQPQINESTPPVTSPQTLLTIPQFPRGTGSLSFAPFTPMSETVGDYILPRIAPESKEVPWQYYGKAMPTSKRPVIAIVITGLGQSRSITNLSLELPPVYTLSFSPYTKDSPLWVINARNKGFEAWVDLPVQPVDFPASDPGPKAILEDKTPEDNMKNLHWALSRFQGFVGVVVPSYEKLTSNEVLATTVMRELSARGIQLAFVQTPINKDFSNQAVASKSLVIPADMNLDEKLLQHEILKQLDTLVAKAKKDGHAVGQLRAYPVALETLKHWTGSLKDSGVDLVPLSAIAQKIQ